MSYFYCLGAAICGSAASVIGKFALDDEYTVPIAEWVGGSVLSWTSTFFDFPVCL